MSTGFIKLVWAQANPSFFPLDVNTADKLSLLRVPGIGPETAKKIIELRAGGRIFSPSSLPLKGRKLELAHIYLKF